MNVQVVSTGSYLPGDPITNEDLEALIGPLPEDILEGIQVKTRHWMVDPRTGEHRINNAEMAFEATRQALDAVGLEADEVDLLITSTASPEYPLPPMVTFLQERLGLTRCATMEIRSGCAGAVEALDVARMYLEHGRHRTAVVIGSEAISPLLVPVYLGKDPDSIRMRDRMTPYNFGDGAGAIVLQASDDAMDGSQMLPAAIASVGGDRKPGMQIVGSGTFAPVHEQLKMKKVVDLQVDIVESGRFTPFVLTEALADVVRLSGVAAEDIDLCIIPEGNAGYMTDELREAGLLTPEWTALEGKIFENLALIGATGSAAVPLALDHAWKTGAVKQGDKVMLLAIETSKWKYAGNVFTWTAAPVPRASAVGVAEQN